MDYKSQLAKENSKQNTNLIVNDIGDNQTKFDELVKLFLSSDYRIVQRASNVIGIVGEKQPQLVLKHIHSFIDYLKHNPIDAVKRNVVRVFQLYKNLPYENGDLYDICLNFITSNQEPIAVKAFSMTICRRYCEHYPELVNEVIPGLELLIEEDKSPGIQSRGKKELKNLYKIKSQNEVE